MLKIEAMPGLVVPRRDLMELPERVMQFGTGVLLRALVDLFIDKANKQGLFNGRVVVVKSTPGSAEAFAKQDGLYTVCARGIHNGSVVEENTICAAISRVLEAQTQWSLILQCAHDPNMKIIVSNTTEVGITLQEDNVNAQPPSSFPGKLLRFLMERYLAFHGDPAAGMVIIPTELITDNGSTLRNILITLAQRNHLDQNFIHWLSTHNRFCNSLVDRIVPGKPAKENADKLQLQLGYEDELLTMSELFRLWAIEGDEQVKEILSFHQADEGMVITPDITLYKELKLRLLNGTHTFSCGTAFLSGFRITRDATTDGQFSKFMRKLMFDEIAPSIPLRIDEDVKHRYAEQVLERFANPYIDHQWLSITLQYSSKMKMRNLPLLEQYYRTNDQPPMMMATGFAAYILFMKAVRKVDEKFFGRFLGEEYEIKDDQASLFHAWWDTLNVEQVVEKVLSSRELWDKDLRSYPGFQQAVTKILMGMLAQGVFPTLKQITDR